MKDKVDIQIYEAENGKSPYLQWESKLNQKARAIVTARLARVRIGNFGDCKPIRGTKGFYELRIHFESGYRIYFGKCKESIILLLLGGNKNTQKKDIKKAKQYWQYYLVSQKR